MFYRYSSPEVDYPFGLTPQDVLSGLPAFVYYGGQRAGATMFPSFAIKFCLVLPQKRGRLSLLLFCGWWRGGVGLYVISSKCGCTPRKLLAIKGSTVAMNTSTLRGPHYRTYEHNLIASCVSSSVVGTIRTSTFCRDGSCRTFMLKMNLRRKDLTCVREWVKHVFHKR